MSQTPQRNKGYLPISAYALIGDCHTSALVGADGSIDFYCPQRFDASAVFCRLLDAEKGGFTSVTPTGEYSVERSYKGATNLLQTAFHTERGSARLTDFMPVYHRQRKRRGYDVANAWRIVRLVEGIEGDTELEVKFKPTFDFAQANTELAIEEGGAVAEAGHNYLTLSCPGIELRPDHGGEVSGTFRVRQGERLWIVLTDANDPDQAKRELKPGDCDEFLSTTEQYWNTWAARCTFRGPYRDEVLRSALTLKMLTYEPTGAIIAAPTTSLPEEIGGVRNWDYRYSWLRDASLILYALMTIGYQDEAEDFISFLKETQGRDPTSTPQIMYAIDGRRRLTERTLDNLSGYMASRPVRVGNGAYSQFQLDIYGEVLTAAYVHYQTPSDRAIRRQSGRGRRPARRTWEFLRALVDQASDNWQEPDNGIWEVRGGKQRFLYSQLMCWAALDRGIRLAEEHQLPADIDRWKHTRDEIFQAILTRGYNEEIGAFTQAFDSKALDASALSIPRVGFLPPTDPRVQSTIRQVQKHLTRDGLVYRYRDEDGLPGGEATFTLCTLWLVDALALAGRIGEARDLFEGVLKRANDVGLLSEEIEPSTGRQIGNFPQGFTHLAIIRAAVDLAKAAKMGPEHHPETEAKRAGEAKVAARQGYSGKSPSGKSSDEGTRKGRRNSLRDGSVG